MFMSLPPTKQRWVYDDPSGLAEPTAYPRPWHNRRRRPTPIVTLVRPRPRVTHREG